MDRCILFQGSVGPAALEHHEFQITLILPSLTDKAKSKNAHAKWPE